MRLRGLTAQRDRASKPTVPSMRTSDAQEDQSKRSPDNVRQDECWFSHLIECAVSNQDVVMSAFRMYQ